MVSGCGCKEVLYRGIYWNGANFSIFRMIPRHTKIKSTKIFTFEI